MSASRITTGLTLLVDTFNHNQQLEVKIESSISIDHGASARIYRGRVQLPYFSYDVALKVIPHVLSEAKEELIRRELKMVKLLAERSSRRILPFIGTTTLGFHTIIVSDFMWNGNMLQYFGNQPDVDRRPMIIQVAEAVYWLHSCKGLVHGDLKCENVLISNERTALLADFGLATLVEQDESSVTTVTAIRNINTLRFAAPEQLSGSTQLDGARPRSKTCETDVYAFGMLVLQAFTLVRPWPQLRDEAVLLQVLSGALHPRPPTDDSFSGMDDTWWSVCVACWRYDPILRQSMYVVFNDLAEHSCGGRERGILSRRKTPAHLWLEARQSSDGHDIDLTGQPTDSAIRSIIVEREQYDSSPVSSCSTRSSSGLSSLGDYVFSK